MPDFTVIEGGGDPTHWDRIESQRYFADFVITLLRDLANGDASHQITEQFLRFVEHAHKSKVAIGPVFDSAMKDLYTRAFDTEGEPLAYEIERKDITHAALRVTAESMATDNFARARLSKRNDNLTRAVEAKILGSEKRSRENGWSYVNKLTERLGRQTPRKK